MTSCQAAGPGSVGRAVIIAASSTLCCGWRAPGGRWRDLPERFGDHQAVKRRYYRWIERGTWDGFLDALTTEADLEWLMIDSTIVRAHQHAAGARVAKGGACPRPGPIWRRAEHKDPRRNRRARQPRSLLFGPGQRNDITQAHALIEGFETEAVIADKGYDADHLREAVLKRGAEPVIPSKIQSPGAASL